MRELRCRKGLSQAEVAFALGINPVTYYGYESASGVFPAIYIKPLCKLYGISASELFDYSEPAEKNVEPKTADERLNALERMMMQLLDERRRQS